MLIPSEKKFVCTWEDCGKKYLSLNALRLHQKEKQHTDVRAAGKIQCAVMGCGKKFPTMLALCAHVKDDHQAPESVIKQAYFRSYEEFKEWRLELEKNTASNFVQQCAGKTYKFKTHIYFYCHRSGQRCKDHVPMEKRRRLLKSQGWCKMNGNCTAHISVTIDVRTNEVAVKYCSYHSGHGMDVEHLRLSTRKRMGITALIHPGVTVSKVMDSMKVEDSLPQRDNQLSRRDISSIKPLFNVGCIQKDTNDHTSVHMWVEEMTDMGDENPVILYKPQGADPTYDTEGLSKNDFILCLQTTAQRQSMIDFSNNNMVCLDCTSSSNRYEFNLVTMMVIDDYGEGSPVAFMICNRDDESALRAFFRAVKDHIPEGVNYSASHVMSDDAGQYHQAWISVFGPAVKELCTWHIDRAWREAIKELVPEVTGQIEVYHRLRSVLQEKNQDAFKQSLESLMQHLQSEVPNFAAYFESFCDRATEWAYCYRSGVRATTNVFVASFHYALKFSYVERRANRRVDSLVSILLRLARDKAFERLTKVPKNTLGLRVQEINENRVVLITETPQTVAGNMSRKVEEINERHVILVSELPEMVSGGWVVPSETHHSRNYFVVAVKDSCECTVRCSVCRCCPDMYQCSCVDFALNTTVCQHVHTIHELRRRSSLWTLGSLTGQVQPTPVDSEPSVDPLLLHDRLKSECKVKLMQLLTQVSADTNAENNKALSCLLTHLRTATCSYQALVRSQAGTMHGSQKLQTDQGRQLKFFCTKAKRRPLKRRAGKVVSSNEVARRSVVTDPGEGPSTTRNTRNIVLRPVLFSSGDVPDYVGTEVVLSLS